MCNMVCEQCTLSPATIAVQGCYRTDWSQGSLKPPIHVTSTFIAETAQALADEFVRLYGLDGQGPRPSVEQVYTRAGNPSFQIFEDRIRHLEGAEGATLLGSGMAAIVTTLLALTRHGDTILFGSPVYGGTDFLLREIMPDLGRKVVDFVATEPSQVAIDLIHEHSPKVVFMESPSNPLAQLTDIQAIAQAAHEHDPETIVIADNTIATFVTQRVLQAGADLSLYSLSKMIGGHDDLIAGLVMGPDGLIKQIKSYRTIFGTISSPHDAWMLSRSLETLNLRAEATERRALEIAKFLHEHPAVVEVLYPGFYQSDEQMQRFDAHCTGHGSFLSIRVHGGREAAYRVLDVLKVFKIGVSMGGTISLASHPKTHSHSDVAPATQELLGIDGDLIRLSVGLEDVNDLRNDLAQALDQIA